MAVVEVNTKRFSVELIHVPLSGLNHARGSVKNTVHVAGVDAMEMNAVLMIAGVDELDPHAVALIHAQGRPGDAAVVGPGRELQSGNDFNDRVLRNNRVFSQRLTIRQLVDPSGIEVSQYFGGVKTVFRVVHFTDNRGHQVMSVAVWRLWLFPE